MQTSHFSAAKVAAEQCYQRGSQLVAARQFEPAQQLLAQAAQQGHARALCLLAMMRQHGWGQRADPAAAIQMYRTAAADGDGEAALRLALCHLHGRWLAFDAQATAGFIAQAAKAGHPQALCVLSVLAPAMAQAAGADQQAQRSWLLQLSSAAVPVDMPRLHMLLLGLFNAPLPEACVLRSEVPAVRYVDGVLNESECRYLIDSARPNLKPARVISPVTRQLVQDPARTNQSAPLGTGGADLPLALIEWRIARLAELPLAHAEYLAALRYAPGEEYRPHRDYLIERVHPEQFAAGGAGQRRRTAFAYLNSVPAGGETEFPQLDLKILPQPGRVVIFDNVDPAGQPEPRSLHAGRAVISGEKWLATLWFRERPLRVA